MQRGREMAQRGARGGGRAQVDGDRLSDDGGSLDEAADEDQAVAEEPQMRDGRYGYPLRCTLSVGILQCRALLNYCYAVKGVI